MSIIKEGNQIVVVFGTGDVIISAASPVRGGLNTELVFSNSTKEHAIGDTCPESIGVSTDELDGPVIRLQFNRLESLQVVEDTLLAIKKDMEKARDDEKISENKQ